MRSIPPPLPSSLVRKIAPLAQAARYNRGSANQPSARELLMSQPKDVPPSLSPSEAEQESPLPDTPQTFVPDTRHEDFRPELVEPPPEAPLLPKLPVELAERYALVARLGKGGMGEVLRGRDTAL